MAAPQDINVLSDKPIQVVHSADHCIREAGTSGGFVSELIRYLFETNQIGATISYRFSGASLFVPELIFAWEDYRQTGSIYHEVHLTKFLKENLHRIHTNVAIVCLPCQCKAIRKLLAKTNHQVILISLTCSGQLSKEATYDFLHRHSVNIKHVHALQYRGNGWPSGMQVVMDNGKHFFFHNCESNWIAYFHSTIYTLKRCFQCTDTFGLDADFIVADPWIQRYIEKDTIGNSVVVANSKRSKGILENLITDKRLVLKETISLSEFFASQKGTVKKKAAYRTYPRLRWLTKFYQTPLGKYLFFRLPKLHYRIHSKILNHLSARTHHDQKNSGY